MSRFLRLALLGSAVVLAAGLPAAAGAGTASPGSWRIVEVLRHCHATDSLLSVTATGPRDAWALGEPNGSGQGCDADLEHWNGAAWRRVAVPRGTFLSTFPTFSLPLAASSASDAWIFPTVVGWSDSYSYALQWNGRAWRKLSLPAGLNVRSAVAFGPRDVWAFGWISKSVAVQVPAAARYDGRAWHVIKMPGEPEAVSAPSRRAIWAVGPTRTTAGKSPTGQRIIAMRWSGKTWRVVALPKIRVHSGQAYNTAFAAAVGPRRLWWSYQVTGRAGYLHAGLLRWDGTRWHHVAVPAAITGAGAMTPDGHGGLWVLATVEVNYNEFQYWYHYRAGRWGRQLVPSPKGYDNVLFGLARVPGTTSALAVGEADANQGNGSIAVIARYGQ